MNFCILIPAFNAEEHIRSVITHARHYCDSIVVIDDGSTDWTAQEAERAGAHVIKHNHNKGKGAALKTGFRYATEHSFNGLITLDADGQHDPQDIGLLLEAAGEAYFVIGSRMHSKGEMPLMIHLSNRLVSFIISCLCRTRIHDTQSGFRFLSRAVFTAKLPEYDRYEFETALLMQSVQKGFRVKEVPIKTIYHKRTPRPTIWKDMVDFCRLLLNLSKL